MLPPKKRLFYFSALLPLIFCLFLSTDSLAQQPGDAWGYACAGTVSPVIAGNMYEFNKTTGAETLLGPACGGGTPSLFTGEFVNGVYYAINNSTRNLVTVAADGSCTIIGSVTFSVGYTASGLSHNIVTGLTYFMTTNVGTTELYTIDLATGVTSLVGTNTGSGISLIIDGQGNAYQIDLLTDKVNTLNLNNASVTPGPQINDGVNPININFAQDLDADCDDLTGDLIGVIYSGFGTGRLGKINLATGVFTQTALIGTHICGFSINNVKVDEPQIPVPTLNQWGLFILGLLILNLSIYFLLKNQAQTKIQ